MVIVCTLCHHGLCGEYALCLQTSAKDATNVDQAFYHIANQAIQNKFGRPASSVSFHVICHTLSYSVKVPVFLLVSILNVSMWNVCLVDIEYRVHKTVRPKSESVNLNEKRQQDPKNKRSGCCELL